jgi:hypothetical protein
MNCVARTLGMLAAAVLLVGCSYQPSLQHPKLPALVPIETTMDCRQIDHAIDRADTVRWVIRDDGGQLETSGEKAARYTGNFFLVPLTMLGGAPLYVRDGGHAVLNAADGRIRQLLQLKRDHGCPPRATTAPGIDDLALLRELETLQQQLDAGQGDEAALFKERSRLLDGLRVVPAPAAEQP